MNILAYIFIAVFVALGWVIAARTLEGGRMNFEYGLLCFLFLIVAAIVGDIAWGGFFA